MMILYLKWKGGIRNVVNDIFQLSVENGYAIMNNNDLMMHSVCSNVEKHHTTKLDEDEIECGIKASGVYYLVYGEGFAKNNLQIIETQIKQLLSDAKARDVTTEIVPLSKRNLRFPLNHLPSAQK